MHCAELLDCSFGAAQDKLVHQQLGPEPPATASPGMILQYNTMFSERKRSLVIDNINGLVESIAALLVKVCAGTVASCRAPEQQQHPCSWSSCEIASSSCTICGLQDQVDVRSWLCVLDTMLVFLCLQVALCRALMGGVLSSPDFCWRLLLLPCW
jgi:hypothetical protein